MIGPVLGDLLVPTSLKTEILLVQTYQTVRFCPLAYLLVWIQLIWTYDAELI